MSKFINTEMTDEDFELLERVAREEHLEIPALVRKLLLQQLTQYQVQKMAEYYRKEIVSLAEAATMAHVSIYEMMDYLQKEGIRPPRETQEDIAYDVKKSLRSLEEGDSEE